MDVSGDLTIYTCQGRQQDGSGSDQQDGQPEVGSATAGNQRSVGLLLSQTDHNYCRVPARPGQCNGGQAVQGVHELQRVEAGQRGLPDAKATMGTSGHTLVCESGSGPTGQVRQL